MNAKYAWCWKRFHIQIFHKINYIQICIYCSLFILHWKTIMHMDKTSSVNKWKSKGSSLCYILESNSLAMWCLFSFLIWATCFYLFYSNLRSSLHKLSCDPYEFIILKREIIVLFESILHWKGIPSKIQIYRCLPIT